MSDGARFPQRYLPLLFALPQLLALLLFFYWPSLQALWWSLHRIQPFGNGERFTGLANYVRAERPRGVGGVACDLDFQPERYTVGDVDRLAAGGLP